MIPGVALNAPTTAPTKPVPISRAESPIDGSGPDASVPSTPYTWAIVPTTTSLATNPVRRDPAASHVPNPAGSNAGATTPDTVANAESSTSVSAKPPLPPTGIDMRNQTTIMVPKMMDPAPPMNAVTRVQVWNQIVRGVGSR